ncbi:MAG: hypothetical protein J5379_05900 [Clostridiales bacterium]|nr:hypothetical protein [Clostridiales bacterium]
MSVSENTNTASNAAGKVAKVLFLSLFALVLVVVSVSFAVHHMRIGFENEYRRTLVSRIQTDAKNAALAVSGEEIKNDSSAAALKYSSVLPYMLMDTNEDDYSTQAFGLYEYNNGSLTMLTKYNSDLLVAEKIPVSEWLTSEMTPYEIKDEYVYHYMVPVKDQEGKVVALLELSTQYRPIDEMGDDLESKLLKTVIVAVLVALAIFSLQYIIPPIVRLVSKQNTEATL